MEGSPKGYKRLRSILCFYCLVCQKKHMRQMPGEHNRISTSANGWIHLRKAFKSYIFFLANLHSSFFHFKSSNLIFSHPRLGCRLHNDPLCTVSQSLVPVSCFWDILASKTWHYSVQIMFGQESPEWWPTKSTGSPMEKKHMTTSYCSNRLHLVSRRFWFVSLFNDEILGLWHGHKLPLTEIQAQGVDACENASLSPGIIVHSHGA